MASPEHQTKTIEWPYLPDEQLADVITKYPFYTMANVEVFKRTFIHNTANFENVKVRSALFFIDSVHLISKSGIKNKIIDEVDTNIQINNLLKGDAIEGDASLPGIADLKNSNFDREPLIPVEPLHTVDYFLSQGIKITEDPASNDKLGTQLKSFTAWLKSMKKVHPDKPVPEAESTDRIIQSIAEHSNAAAGVETEAMAEVLISQGKRLQALEIYQKLSLKNPAESAYFAAKIKNLKQA